MAKSIDCNHYQCDEMSSKAAPLKAAVKQHFYPYATAQGFTRLKSTNPMFTSFRRENEGTVHTFDIQWDKYWRPRFVLNVYAAGDGRGIVPIVGRLQRRRGGGMSCWFGTQRSWLSRIGTGRWSYTPYETVASLISVFPELEQWWQNDTQGPHLYLWC